MRPNPLFLAVLTIFLQSVAAHAETAVSGRVVVFREDKSLGEVTVRARKVDGDRGELAATKTDSSGRYSFKLQDNVEEFGVTYDPPNSNDYDPAGRTHIIRVGRQIELDTIGLTKKKGGTGDNAEQATQARNVAGYARAGGDQANARAAVNDALKRYGASYERYIQLYRLRDAIFVPGGRVILQ